MCLFISQLHRFLADMPFYGSGLHKVELVAPSLLPQTPLLSLHEVISAHAQTQTIQT